VQGSQIANLHLCVSASIPPDTQVLASTDAETFEITQYQNSMTDALKIPAAEHKHLGPLQDNKPSHKPELVGSIDETKR
jgi:hypothetical protein